MPRELEPWGGEVKMPRWLARLLHRRRATETDSPERAQERHKPQYPDRTVLENVDRAMFGAFTQPSKDHRHPPGEK
jgi:hypothetical protein